MSRLGKKPISVAAGVTVKVANGRISVAGPKGTLNLDAPELTTVTYDESARSIQVTRANDTTRGRANHGLARSLLANMVQGVSEGFQKRLLIYGTGYNCKVAGRVLHLNIGFMGRNRGQGSQFELPIPDGVEIEIETAAARGDTDPAKLVVRGFDKQKVGQFAAEVRALRKTEPYKGKGIRYEGEYVRRKQGKALAGSG